MNNFCDQRPGTWDWGPNDRLDDRGQASGSKETLGFVWDDPRLPNNGSKGLAIDRLFSQVDKLSSGGDKHRLPPLSQPLLNKSPLDFDGNLSDPVELNSLNRPKFLGNPFDRTKLANDKQMRLPPGNPNANPFSNPNNPCTCCDCGCKVHCCRHRPFLR
jgi:hypothetical protein